MSEGSGLEEVVREFVAESREDLDRAEGELAAMAGEGDARAAVAGVFRAVHTIKGNCGFLGFGRLESVAHVGESVLARLRDGTLAPSAEVAAALRDLVGAIRSTLERIETTGLDGPEGHAELIARLERLARSLPVRDEGAPPAIPDAAGGPFPERAAPLKAPSDEGALAVAVREAEGGWSSDGELRVDRRLLDALVGHVGELVIARNRLQELCRNGVPAALDRAVASLGAITAEIQGLVLRTRMEPIATVWARLPLLVRSAADACGKRVRLLTEGGETELDRSVLEAVRGPFVQAIRNAIDHGIESPDRRSELGKDPVGTISLTATCDGGHVVMEIRDDGAGIDPEALVRRALERGLIRREEVERLSPAERLNLIFLPGLSTASEASALSGRGVGMDVVRHSMERLGGTVDVSSRLGEGAAIRMTAPPSLSIIRALLVVVAGRRYAIPLAAVREVVAWGEGLGAAASLARAGEGWLLRARDEVLPLVDAPAAFAGAVGVFPEGGRAVIVDVEERRYAIAVDGVADVEDAVVSPLGVEEAACFAGATILGDGRVALIVDLLGLGQRLGAVSGLRSPGRRRAAPSRAGAVDPGEPSWLLVEGGGRSAAVPIAMVERLERIRSGGMARVGERCVIESAGAPVPVVPLGAGGVGPRERVAVVCEIGGRRAALGVERVLDVGAGPRGADVGGGEAALAAGRILEVVDAAWLRSRLEKCGGTAEIPHEG